MDKLGEGMPLAETRVSREQSHRGDGSGKSRPLYHQIADEVRRQISAGDLRSGDLLPSEHELMRRFGVSRGTVRQALATLRADGTVTGSQGRPLAVRGSYLTQPLSELVSFSAWASSLGKRPSGRVIAWGPRPADDDVAAVLEVQPGTMVYHLVRVRLADDEPLLIERTDFQPRVGQLLVGIDLERHSIYAELARRGIVVASARHVVGAMAASRADARLLAVAARTPLLRVRRRAFALSGEPLEWSDDRYLADRVDFAIENNMTVSGAMRRIAEIGGH